MRRDCCFSGRASRFVDSNVERLLHKYEWRLWLGGGFDLKPRIKLGRIRRTMSPDIFFHVSLSFLLPSRMEANPRLLCLLLSP